MKMKPIIFNIQRISMHDGPGVRTTVFFKGCSLNCKWCHNPESISRAFELKVEQQLCTGCGKCVDTCKAKACSLRDGHFKLDREKCRYDFSCVGRCYFKALEKVGKMVPISEILTEVLKDRKMYEISGGGVTLSGGEPLLQPDAAEELLRELHSEGIHTAVDTAGLVSWRAFERIIPYTDLFLYDLKAWEEEVHIRCTGASNRIILDNFDKLEMEADIFVRIPVVEDMNADQLPYLADFLKNRRHVKKIELLSYHRLGKTKYENLGYEFKDFITPSWEKMLRYKELFMETGCEVTAVS